MESLDDRVYYGEYSLKHWIDLIIKGISFGKNEI